MPVRSLQPVRDRWCDIHGTPIVLFCWVEQIAECAERTALPSRLHQHGQVVGRGDESLLVCFGDNQVISLRPHQVRMLDAVPDSD